VGLDTGILYSSPGELGWNLGGVCSKYTCCIPTSGSVVGARNKHSSCKVWYSAEMSETGPPPEPIRLAHQCARLTGAIRLEHEYCLPWAHSPAFMSFWRDRFLCKTFPQLLEGRNN
jgi:hypothetical protein